jgi:hypothetical protein
VNDCYSNGYCYWFCIPIRCDGMIEGAIDGVIGAHDIFYSFLFRKFYFKSFDGKQRTYEGPAAAILLGIGFNPAVSCLSTISGRIRLLDGSFF